MAPSVPRLSLGVILWLGATARADFHPAAAVDGYTATVMPCAIDAKGRVACTGDLLEKKTLRELTILRNTIYARWGWDGFRKPWLASHFHAQPWFVANPKFSYRLLSDADRKNAHFIAAREQSFTSAELQARRQAILAKATRTADDTIELGLIGRAAGEFATDGKDDSHSLDQLLTLAELRQLSSRDLRLLRNTIYARRGRAFKSPILQEHFTWMDWYTVNPDYSDKLLSKNDTRNIALIKSVENELGGPVSDEAWLTEPATDGA